LRTWLLAGLLALTGSAWAETDSAVSDYLGQVFSGDPPPAQALWLTGERKQMTTQIMGHDYPALRLRYWLRDGTSVWILEEIGKTEPITAGFTVNHSGLQDVSVLVYRESRGGEVQYPFFTRQFQGATLKSGHHLDRDIDGITGATLSVRAMTKLSRLALFLHQQVTEAEETVIARR
jgi:hypothetical protein